MNSSHRVVECRSSVPQLNTKLLPQFVASEFCHRVNVVLLATLETRRTADTEGITYKHKRIDVHVTVGWQDLCFKQHTG